MRKEDLVIDVNGVSLSGIMTLPAEVQKLIIFSHGSGSSRFSPRNTFVADVLVKAGLASLLIDLLTQEEEEVYDLRFDIPLLSQRLVGVTDVILSMQKFKAMKIGYFGASTGAASALCAAAELKDTVFAIVSRGGRPDLAMDSLKEVMSPVLLIVGGADEDVLELNRKAMIQLSCEKKLEVIPGATHLFEEEGTLEQVAILAKDWFQQH